MSSVDYTYVQNNALGGFYIYKIYDTIGAATADITNIPLGHYVLAEEILYQKRLDSNSEGVLQPLGTFQINNVQGLVKWRTHYKF